MECAMHKKQSTPTSNVGIDIRHRHTGETILVETEDGVFELTVTDASQGMVRVSGTDPRLHTLPQGCLTHSINPARPKDRQAFWIGPGLRMIFAFRNAVLESGCVMSATIRGPGWHYDVF
jgi:hypothetical protein